MAAWLSLALGVRLHGVVDRIEGGYAVVEWAGEATGDVPVCLLPADVSEGDAVVLRLRRGVPVDVVLSSKAGPIRLPSEVSPRGLRAEFTRPRRRSRGSTKRECDEDVSD